MRAVPARTCLHHSSPGPGNSTEPRVPPGCVPWLSGNQSVQRQCWRDPVISRITGWASRAAQAGTQLCLRGHQTLPGQPAEAKRGCQVTGTATQGTLQWALEQRSGLMAPKITASHQEAPHDATVVAPLQPVGKQIFCQLSHCYSDPDISIC